MTLLTAAREYAKEAINEGGGVADAVPITWQITYKPDVSIEVTLRPDGLWDAHAFPIIAGKVLEKEGIELFSGYVKPEPEAVQPTAAEYKSYLREMGE